MPTKTTTLKLTLPEIDALMNGLQSVWKEELDETEQFYWGKMYNRMVQASCRVQMKESNAN